MAQKSLPNLHKTNTSQLSKILFFQNEFRYYSSSFYMFLFFFFYYFFKNILYKFHKKKKKFKNLKKRLLLKKHTPIVCSDKSLPNYTLKIISPKEPRHTNTFFNFIPFEGKTNFLFYNKLRIKRRLKLIFFKKNLASVFIRTLRVCIVKLRKRPYRMLKITRFIIFFLVKFYNAFSLVFYKKFSCILFTFKKNFKNNSIFFQPTLLSFKVFLYYAHLSNSYENTFFTSKEFFYTNTYYLISGEQALKLYSGFKKKFLQNTYFSSQQLILQKKLELFVLLLVFNVKRCFLRLKKKPWIYSFLFFIKKYKIFLLAKRRLRALKKKYKKISNKIFVIAKQLLFKKTSTNLKKKNYFNKKLVFFLIGFFNAKKRKLKNFKKLYKKIRLFRKINFLKNLYKKVSIFRKKKKHFKIKKKQKRSFFKTRLRRKKIKATKMLRLTKWLVSKKTKAAVTLFVEQTIKKNLFTWVNNCWYLDRKQAKEWWEFKQIRKNLFGTFLDAYYKKYLKKKILRLKMRKKLKASLLKKKLVKTGAVKKKIITKKITTKKVIKKKVPVKGSPNKVTTKKKITLDKTTKAKTSTVTKKPKTLQKKKIETIENQKKVQEPSKKPLLAKQDFNAKQKFPTVKKLFGKPMPAYKEKYTPPYDKFSPTKDLEKSQPSGKGFFKNFNKKPYGSPPVQSVQKTLPIFTTLLDFFRKKKTKLSGDQISFIKHLDNKLQMQHGKLENLIRLLFSFKKKNMYWLQKKRYTRQNLKLIFFKKFKLLKKKKKKKLILIKKLRYFFNLYSFKKIKKQVKFLRKKLLKLQLLSKKFKIRRQLKKKQFKHANSLLLYKLKLNYFNNFFFKQYLNKFKKQKKKIINYYGISNVSTRKKKNYKVTKTTYYTFSFFFFKNFFYKAYKNSIIKFLFKAKYFSAHLAKKKTYTTLYSLLFNLKIKILTFFSSLYNFFNNYSNTYLYIYSLNIFNLFFYTTYTPVQEKQTYSLYFLGNFQRFNMKVRVLRFNFFLQQRYSKRFFKARKKAKYLKLFFKIFFVSHYLFEFYNYLFLFILYYKHLRKFRRKKHRKKKKLHYIFTT